MTTTSVDDAIILPQSQGTGLSGEESVIDAAINGVLNRYVGGEYVASEYSTGLAFQNHSSSNDTVEVGPGIVFIQDNSSSTGGERGSGGNPQAESSTTSGYDTELPEGHTYAVLLPTATEISVSDSTLNEVHVDIDDVTANNSVNLEHDGSTTASPGNTSLKIGETNPDDASADTRANDDPNPTFNSLEANGAVIDYDKYAAFYNGADPDARLDNALSAASTGDSIKLEVASYGADRTISKQVSLVGSKQGFSGTGVDNNTWTISSVGVDIIGVALNNSSEIKVNESNFTFLEGALSGSAKITIDDNRARVNNNISFGTIEFTANAQNGISIANSGTGTYTDNNGGNVTSPNTT